MQYEKEKINGYRLVDRNLWARAITTIFSKEELEIILLIGDIQQAQLGNESWPKGIDHEQANILMSSETAKNFAKRAGEWYKQNGGKGKALALPFMVGVTK